MPSSQIPDIEIINMGVKAGTHARGVDRTTINNVLSVFYGEQDPLKGVLLTQIYISRQRRRGEIPEDAARIMMGHLKRIYDSLGRDQELLKRAVDLYFLAMKWSFESEVPPSSDMEDFVNKAIGGG